MFGESSSTRDSAMLIQALILTKGGLVIWERKFGAGSGSLGSNNTRALINAQIHKQLVLHGSGTVEQDLPDSHGVKLLTTPSLIFLVVYDSKTWRPSQAESFLSSLLHLFTQTPRAEVDWRRSSEWLEGFESRFDVWLEEFNQSDATTTTTTPTRKARNLKKSSTMPASLNDSPTTPKGKRPPRIWDNQHGPVRQEQLIALDYSGSTATTTTTMDNMEKEEEEEEEERGVDGSYQVKQLLSSTPKAKETSKLLSFFKGVIQGRPLTREDLDPVLKRVKEHLIQKNVAAPVAEQVCQVVHQSLEGTMLSSFTRVQTVVEQQLEQTIRQILTPTSPIDLLYEIRQRQRPYVICFVGVNGVGKSTNLAKVCYWLLKNNLKVLIAACDTFRSGAVEQLRIHVQKLALNCSKEDQVQLFEKGYGKDSAGIAKEAIQQAALTGRDVVLVDTAGRMQDNEPLMRALAKLVSVNNPDKIIFVGEALVGNEALSQLSGFNQALRDFSNLQQARQIDAILLSKFDTVDDQVGAALSMVHLTSRPILFVGTGQTYRDLKTMSVELVLQSLLS